ncbi:hypothetical protein V6R21_29940 [Limibacter armeniacum]|uniref:toxin-antitoxin system YwqK family antitoxin n=1 Tax=Limibacter armeniacum TaxID=466084 RepID=UPI002FE5E862
MKRFFISILLLCYFTAFAQAQELSVSEDQAKPDSTVVVKLSELDEDDPTIELNPGKNEEKELVKRRVKKKKKNVFWNIKTKKRFTKKVRGNNVEFELFFVLREWEDPDRYVASKFYYNHDKRKIEKTNEIHRKYGMPLHGTYVKIVNGDTLVTGQFYKGVRTGRWISYQRDSYNDDLMIQDKVYYYRGYPKNAEITYYDSKRKKVKEVIPYQYGVKDGTYLKYYPSGRLMETGTYRDGHKVNRWFEYYDKYGRGSKKRETQYRKKTYDDNFEPYIIREWDDTGNSTYDRTRESRRNN